MTSQSRKGNVGVKKSAAAIEAEYRNFVPTQNDREAQNFSGGPLPQQIDKT